MHARVGFGYPYCVPLGPPAVPSVARRDGEVTTKLLTWPGTRDMVRTLAADIARVWVLGKAAGATEGTSEP